MGAPPSRGRVDEGLRYPGYGLARRVVGEVTATTGTTGMSERDLLLEFIQWLMDNPGYEPNFDARDADEDDALRAAMAVDEFLESMGVQS